MTPFHNSTLTLSQICSNLTSRVRFVMYISVIFLPKITTRRKGKKSIVMSSVNHCEDFSKPLRRLLLTSMITLGSHYDGLPERKSSEETSVKTYFFSFSATFFVTILYS
jgi:hypothetical protein